MEHGKNTELSARAAAPTAMAATRSRRRVRRPPLVSKLSAARQAVRAFLLRELRAREVRITKVAPAPEGDEGWRAEAEMLVPDLDIKTLGLPLSQEVLEKEYCAVVLDRELQVRSYEFVGREER
jgi:hypothetical protein